MLGRTCYPAARFDSWERRGAATGAPTCAEMCASRGAALRRAMSLSRRRRPRPLLEALFDTAAEMRAETRGLPPPPALPFPGSRPVFARSLHNPLTPLQRLHQRLQNLRTAAQPPPLRVKATKPPQMLSAAPEISHQGLLRRRRRRSSRPLAGSAGSRLLPCLPFMPLAPSARRLRRVDWSEVLGEAAPRPPPSQEARAAVDAVPPRLLARQRQARLGELPPEPPPAAGRGGRRGRSNGSRGGCSS